MIINFWPSKSNPTGQYAKMNLDIFEQVAALLAKKGVEINNMDSEPVEINIKNGTKKEIVNLNSLGYYVEQKPNI